MSFCISDVLGSADLVLHVLLPCNGLLALLMPALHVLVQFGCGTKHRAEH